MTGPDFQFLAVPGSILVLITALLLLAFQDWRFSLIGLSIQYLGVFFLVGLHWPFVMAATKLIAGWISIAVLGMAAVSGFEFDNELSQEQSQSRIIRSASRSLLLSAFQLATAAMIVLVVLSLGSSIDQWIPALGAADTFGAFILIGLGLLHLGFSSQPLHVILSLLTILSGFEIIYSAVEQSTLVAGMLSGVTLGLAMIGAYLFIAGVSRNEE